MALVTNARGYPIGSMSRRTGVHVETIRYYERIGLMPEPGRTPGGNRQYTRDDMKRLSFIRRSRDLGFGIPEIREMLTMVDRRGVSCAEVHAMTVGHLAVVRDKIARLRKLEAALSEMAAECARHGDPGCPIIEALLEA